MRSHAGAWKGDKQSQLLNTFIVGKAIGEQGRGQVTFTGIRQDDDDVFALVLFLL